MPNNSGLPLSIVMEALQRCSEPKQKILQLMNAQLRGPRESKDCWPCVQSVLVPANRRGAVLGPGGVTLKKLMAKTGVEVIDVVDMIVAIYIDCRGWAHVIISCICAQNMLQRPMAI